MAVYLYADWASWPEIDTLGKLNRLNLHIAEVSLIMNGPDVSADGKSLTRGSMVQYHANLLAERARLDNKSNQTVRVAKFRF